MKLLPDKVHGAIEQTYAHALTSLGLTFGAISTGFGIASEPIDWNTASQPGPGSDIECYPTIVFGCAAAFSFVASACAEWGPNGVARSRLRRARESRSVRFGSSRKIVARAEGEDVKVGLLVRGRDRWHAELRERRIFHAENEADAAHEYANELRERWADKLGDGTTPEARALANALTGNTTPARKRLGR